MPVAVTFSQSSQEIFFEHGLSILCSILSLEYIKYVNIIHLIPAAESTPPPET